MTSSHGCNSVQLELGEVTAETASVDLSQVVSTEYRAGCRPA
jgi:hypothetical protein